MIDELNDLERSALDYALQGDEPWLKSLRTQVERLRVKGRSYTNAGGYTHFAIDGEVEKASIPEKDPNYPPVVLIRHPLLVHGGAFIVWTREGWISSLEGNADGDGEWPVGREHFVAEFSFVNPRHPTLTVSRS